MNVLVVAAAPVGGSAELLAATAPQHDMIIAVDGGGALCLEAGVRPDLVLGDFDSLDPAQLQRLEDEGVAILTYPADKDRTDLELALEEARRLGAMHVTLTAASSGRLDHTLGAIGAMVAAADLTPELIEPGTHAWVLGERGRRDLRACSAGSTISLIAFPQPATVSISGVRWPLDAATLEPGSGWGLSNIITAEDGALVHLHAGVVLVIAPESV